MTLQSAYEYSVCVCAALQHSAVCLHSNHRSFKRNFCFPSLSHVFFNVFFRCNVARVGERRGVHRILVVKSEGKRPLGRPALRWGDNINMGLQEVGCDGGKDWVDLARDRDRWRTLYTR